MRIRLLPPPSVPSGMPRANQRGGVLAAPWVPDQFIDARVADVPFDASTPRPVPMSRSYSPMAFADTLPKPVGMVEEMVGPSPLPIGPYRPRDYPHAGGIFAGAGGVLGSTPVVADMAVARPEWTKWQIQRPLSGLGGCGCGRP